MRNKQVRGIKILTAFLAFLALALTGAGCRALAGPVRYPTAIDWQPYEAALARAKAERKPIMLLFGADWCEPCHQLADNVLSDPRVIEASKGFVMVHVKADERKDLNRKYRLGGNTLPRIYFLTADGALLKAARQRDACNAYTYSREDPTSLLAGMANAQRLTADPTTQPDVDPYAPTKAMYAQLCTSRSDDSACAACQRTHCCLQAQDCLRHASSCDCRNEGAAARALDQCKMEHCPACNAP